MYSSIVSYFIFVVESLSDWKRPPLDGSIWLQDSTMKDSILKQNKCLHEKGNVLLKRICFYSYL